MQERGPALDVDDLFAPGGFLIDTNGDSLPDSIRACIVLEDEPDAEMWSALLDLAARLGVETSGFTPPLFNDNPALDRLPIVVRRGRSIRPHLVADGWHDRPAVILEGVDSIRDLTLRGRCVESNSAKSSQQPETLDLARLFERDGLLIDTDDNQIPDGSRLCVMVPEDLPRCVGMALAHFVVRLGIESSGVDLPIATTAAQPFTGSIPLIMRFDNSAAATLAVTTVANRPALELVGDSNAVAALLDRLAFNWPAPPASTTRMDAPEIANWLRWSLAAWTPEGQTAALIADLEAPPARTTGALRLLGSDPDELKTQTRLARQAAGERLEISGPGRALALFTQEWSGRWEVDRALDLLHERVVPELDRRLPLDLMVIVSEPAQVRQRLRDRITRELVQAGFKREQSRVHVLDAYKTGLSWLREVVLPAWRHIGGIARIELLFQPLETAEGENALDLRIRWLQELFPADEILAAAFGLPLERVKLDEYDGEEIYRVNAYDESGTLLAYDEFSPIWNRRPYIGPFPSAGQVHVVSGGIQARQADLTLVEPLPTDAEAFWDYLHEEVLPAIGSAIMQETGGEPRAEDQPFFDELLIEVTMSETNEPFGIREEMNSAAEALHEDIYFNILDYVETLGAETTGAKLGAPGGIIPIVHVRPGMPPHARIRLRGRARSVARLETESGTTPIGEILATPPLAPTVRSIAMMGAEAQLTFRFESIDEVLQRRLIALSRVVPADPAFPALFVHAGNAAPVALGWPSPRDVPQTSAAGEPVSESRFLNETSLAAQLQRLAAHPEVRIEPAVDWSYQGRPIPGIEVTAPITSAVWSRKKLSIFKPTFFIIARHHANEVASTTAALKLVERLVSDNKWRRLLSRVNIVMLPFENADGAALHDRLQREHPTWKHHPARYNAVGYEFAEDNNNPDTPFGESRVRRRIWQRWLPDIVVDNHGVPSHEWAQIFAGFGSPPRFRTSYWQVQAMIYGILFFMESEQFPEHRHAAHALREEVSRAVSSDAELLQWNRCYRERYVSWGTRWVPERFPATTHRDMIWYFGGYPAGQERARRSPAARYPAVTVASWVTEVPDETAHGEHLRLTAKAHLVANRATIDLLAASATPPERRMLRTARGTRIIVSRRRPIVIGP